MEAIVNTAISKLSKMAKVGGKITLADINTWEIACPSISFIPLYPPDLHVHFSDDLEEVFVFHVDDLDEEEEDIFYSL